MSIVELEKKEAWAAFRGMLMEVWEETCQACARLLVTVI